MTVYCDTSFCVSPDIKDFHSTTADELLRSADRVFLSPLHIAEWHHAIAHHVFRGVMSRTDAERVTREFEADRASGLWLEVPVPENAFALCADLARQYGPKLGIRTFDTLHVASALELKAEKFWTFGERQARLAKAVGLKIA